MKANSVLDTIGNTPLVRINRLFGDRAEVWVKSERANPGGSIKDRIALAMIEDAERSGKLKPGGTIVEPTSGNTGIGLAMVAAVKGYPIILVMPDSMSIERRRLMLAYGAKFELTDKRQGHAGRGRSRDRNADENPDSWMPQQFDNPANVDVHERTTAQEVLADFADAPFDALITGVGTGGHITGLARVLKKAWPQAQGVRGRAGAVAGPQRRQARPASDPGPRRQFRAKHPRPRPARRSDRRRCRGAREMARRSAREEGMLIGISSGASLAAIEMKLPELGEKPRILTFNYDSGERYLSVADFLPQEG